MDDGKYREKWTATRRDAENELRLLTEQRDGRLILAPDKMTVNHLLDEWITASSLKWQGSTRSARVYYMDRYVRPIVGTRLLSALQPRELDNLWTTLERTGARVDDGEKAEPLSRGTVRSIRNMLSTAFNFGVKRRIIPDNPAHRAAVPAERKKAMDVLSVDAAAQLIAALRGKSNEAAILLMLGTAMRIGEVTALRWSDLDRNTRMLIVQRGVKRTILADRRTLGEPKTKASTRIVALPPFVFDALLDHERTQKKARLRSVDWEDQGLMFPDTHGRIMYPTALAYRLEVALKHAKLPHITPHGLRHSCASILLAMGHSPAEVAALLGHSSPAVTMALYAHALPGAKDRVAATMSNLFGDSEGESEDERGSQRGMESN